MTLYLEDPDVTLFHGDVLEQLALLPDESVQCCVTSPPYWGLRDYGTGAWEGGDPDHVHETVGARNGRGGSGAPGKQTEGVFPSVLAVNECSCGARRVDRQLGLEATPDLYVTRMVEVFREVRRVLRADGTLWLNLGDSYASNGPRGDTRSGFNERYFGSGNPGKQAATADEVPSNIVPVGLKPKDLVGIPWRVAFALQADGWYLRSDIIWSKPNPMPESVTDRPTKAHEYVFLLSRSPRYFFDQEAVRERAIEGYDLGLLRGRSKDPSGLVAWAAPSIAKRQDEGVDSRNGNPSGQRNVRSVWSIATQPYPEAHFATFPEELVRRCILAGTSERGCCPECGKPWERETERTVTKEGEAYEQRMERAGDDFTPLHQPNRAMAQVPTRYNLSQSRTETLGWRRTCDHDRAPVSCTVLDPFAGSGTTGLVARKHGRRAVMIELNADYCELTSRRLAQQSLLAVAGV